MSAPPPSEPAEASPHSHELPPGLALGAYTIVRLLARGGMAEIYLAVARHDGAQTPVVIKRVLPHLPERDNPRGMFADEAALSARLHHPNIVEVLDLVEEEDGLFIVLEHLHGADALDILVTSDRLGGRPPLNVAVEIALRVCDGLHYAHELRADDGSPMHVIHRDVSPQNVFVTFEGTVKLLDFGLAKSIFRAVETRDGTAKGKLSYMSPEQVMTRPLDRRTDVFQLGIVLYELCLGQKLYDLNRGELTIIKEIVEGPVPSGRDRDAALPAPIDAVIRRALAKRPDERFPTVFSFAKALEQAAQSSGIKPSAAAVREFMAQLYPRRAATAEFLESGVATAHAADRPEQVPLLRPKPRPTHTERVKPIAVPKPAATRDTARRARLFFVLGAAAFAGALALVLIYWLVLRGPSR